MAPLTRGCRRSRATGRRNGYRSVTIISIVLAGVAPIRSSFAQTGGDRQPFPNVSGIAETVSANGPIDLKNPFFQSLGSNGRACVSCHRPEHGWTIVPAELQARFDATEGQDPVFRTNDGSNSPNADVSTVQARRSAYSMLLTRGLIRVGLPIPQGGEFDLAGVIDPYGYANARELSLFRRPLPTTNLRFLSGVMWDGRETMQPITGPLATSHAALQGNLGHQAGGATTGHAQAAREPTPEQLKQIVAFEMGLHTAQVWDSTAGSLDADGGLAGSAVLRDQEFFIGINDPLGLNPSGAPFEPRAFSLFPRWTGIDRLSVDLSVAARGALARGEAIFNTKKFMITDVSGLNDELGQPRIEGTCTTCHDTPNVGNHSVAAPLNIGISDASRRTPDMPLYTLRNKTTGALVQTTDPGRAMITGRWKDIGRFKGPILRALATRAPYFHNGFSATLKDVVEFYDDRFKIQLTPSEKASLVAFLRSL